MVVVGGFRIRVKVLVLKPKFYDFKVEVFSAEYDILNVDSDEYNYIYVIKDVKRCMAWENKVVEMNPYEKFKVEAGLPLSRAWYLVEGDNDMEFILSSMGVLASER
ncbi:hypothetical protein Pint_31500 [Pistacia integerrima]|uniref:Uncharacterized protein n=1 Tax=Pistacia integerrima TaxID=434235 RepID=A0ACC0XR29_9ROSI|nr:hypothetical protein Pint_31500 [Pistacia integerrima]